jgi:hypothetical protein
MQYTEHTERTDGHRSFGSKEISVFFRLVRGVRVQKFVLYLPGSGRIGVTHFIHIILNREKPKHVQPNCGGERRR